MKNKGMYIGIGVAVVGIAAYFLFFKKKPPTTNKQKGGEEKKEEGKVNDKDGKEENKPQRRMTPFPLQTLRGQNPAILKKGLRNPEDNKVLQSYLNNMSINKLSKGSADVPEELVIDGKFGDKTESALQYHLGKTQITVGELRSMIIGDNLKLLRFNK